MPSPVPSSKPRAPLVILGGTLVILVGSAVLFGRPQLRRAILIGQVARAQADLTAFAAACEGYRIAFGEVPAGTAPEIAHALQGSNALQLVFLPPRERQTNGRGEFVDPWGEPWAFTRPSWHRLEARSAGPNRRPGDHDDLTSSYAATPAPSASPP